MLINQPQRNPFYHATLCHGFFFCNLRFFIAPTNLPVTGSIHKHTHSLLSVSLPSSTSTHHYHLFKHYHRRRGLLHLFTSTTTMRSLNKQQIVGKSIKLYKSTKVNRREEAEREKKATNWRKQQEKWSSFNQKYEEKTWTESKTRRSWIAFDKEDMETNYLFEESTTSSYFDVGAELLLLLPLEEDADRRRNGIKKHRENNSMRRMKKNWNSHTRVMEWTCLCNITSEKNRKRTIQFLPLFPIMRPRSTQNAKLHR